MNAINNKLTAAEGDISALDDALKAIVGMPDQTTLQKINNLEATIAMDLNASLLQANGITDPAEQTKLVDAIKALITIAQKIEAGIPTAVTAGRFQMRKPMTDADFNALSKELKPKAIRAIFDNAMKMKSGNVELDKAFAHAAH